MRLRVAVLALLVAAPACFVFNRGGTAERAPAFDVPEGEIALSVTNHNYLDVVVYVVHDGVQTRVGTVTGSSSAVFFLPARLLGQAREIQLVGDAIGNDSYARTEVLVVQRGQYIEWTLETDLRRSSVGVF
jgi:non-canonical (house-cleaning) NTP pyrophosphatase